MGLEGGAFSRESCSGGRSILPRVLFLRAEYSPASPVFGGFRGIHEKEFENKEEERNGKPRGAGDKPGSFVYYLSPRKGTPSRCARKGTVVRRAHGVCKWRHFHRLLLPRSIRTPSCTHSRHIRPKVIEFRNFECTNSYRAVGAVNHSIDNSERPCDCPVNDSHEGDSFFSYFLFFGLLGITSPTQK